MLLARLLLIQESTGHRPLDDSRFVNTVQNRSLETAVRICGERTIRSDDATIEPYERRSAMKRLATVIILLGVLCLVASCVPHNTCSGKDRIEMKQGGFSTDEINSACTSYRISDDFIKAAAQVAQTELTKKYQNGNQSAAPASPTPYQQNYATAGATTCATQHGQCPLMQPGTSGASCVCYTMYGPIPGVMR